MCAFNLPRKCFRFVHAVTVHGDAVVQGSNWNTVPQQVDAKATTGHEPRSLIVRRSDNRPLPVAFTRSGPVGLGGEVDLLQGNM